MKLCKKHKNSLFFFADCPQLTHIRPMLQSYKNQSIDLQDKRINWFIHMSVT